MTTPTDLDAAAAMNAAAQGLFKHLVFAIVAGVVLSAVARRLRRRREADIAPYLRQVPFWRRHQLPGEVEVLATFGSDGPAPTSLGWRVMQTTIGLRLLTTGGVLALFLLLTDTGVGFNDGGLQAVGLPGMNALIAVAGLTSLLYVWTYELAWDRVEITRTTCFLWKKTFSWRDLQRIEDDRGHYYVLVFDHGRLHVLKGLVGMPDLLEQVGKTLKHTARP